MMEEDHEVPMNLSEDGQEFNFTDDHVNNTNEYDEALIYYDWLADTATMSHISNQCDAFITYRPSTGKTVTGVGNKKTNVEGQGTVELETIYKGNKYLLRLDNVLYIPNNCKNLISLGRWDWAGGQYIGGGGAIVLITKDGKQVTTGTKIQSNLYKMKVSVRKPGASYSKNTVSTPQNFLATEPTQSWETWHKRYGHTVLQWIPGHLNRTAWHVRKPSKRKNRLIKCLTVRQSLVTLPI
jgi:hypothetical protein